MEEMRDHEAEFPMGGKTLDEFHVSYLSYLYSPPMASISRSKC
jgi:hypothetical protein